MSPLVYLALAFISGLLLARSWLDDILFTLILLGIMLVLCLWAYSRRLADLTTFLLVGAFALGGFLYAYAAFFPSQELLQFADEEVKVEGTVVEEPSYQDDRVGYRLLVSRLEHEGDSYSLGGKLQLYHYHRENDGENDEDRLNNEKNSRGYLYGDKIRVEGTLRAPSPQRNPGGFDYRKFLLTQGIDAHLHAHSHQLDYVKEGEVGILPSSAFALRAQMIEGLEQHLPSPHDDLLTAILFGQRERLPEDVQENFNRAGVGHLMAVSGLHIGLVAGLALVMLRRFNLHGSFWTVLALLVVWIYAYLTGMRPPALRAALMISLGMMALWWGRQRDFPTAVALAALLTLAINPLLLFSVGFQLSYAATLAIYYLHPLIQKQFLFFLPRSLQGLVAVTLAAQVGVLPLMVLHFQQLPLAALFFNLLFLPVMALVVGLGLAGTLFSLMSSFLASLIFAANLPLLTYLLFFSSLAEASWVHVEVFPLPTWVVVLYYLLLLLAAGIYYRFQGYSSPGRSFWLSVFYGWGLLKYRGKQIISQIPLSAWGRKVLLGSTLAAVVLFLCLASLFAPASLEVVFLDVGQGASVFLETSCGFTALVDAGGELPFHQEVGEEVGERTILPFLYHRGVRELDVAIITHPHEDHFGGFLPLVERIPVETLLISSVPGESESYCQLLEDFRRQGTRQVKIQRGDAFSPAPDLHFQALSPPPELLEGTNCDLNNNSLVFQVGYGEVDFLLTGDMEEAAVQELMSAGVDYSCQVLKLPHHGGHFDSVDKLLEKAAPAAAVIQVGSNPFGHPNPEVIAALKEKEVPFFRNDFHGAVIFRTDGMNLRVETMLEEKVHP